MKKTILSCALLATFSVANVDAQNFEKLLVMNKYTVPMNVKGAQVGHFVITDRVEDVTLEKDTAGIFQIDKTGVLSLKKNKELTTSSPFRYEIVVQQGGKSKAFEVVKDEFITNTVVSHRGAWKHTGESQNSLGSLLESIKMGCQASEFDVWLTQDNKVALNHDHDIDGFIVEKSTLEDLHRKKLNNGEVLPILEQYVELIKSQNKTRIVLELKSFGKAGNAKSLALADSCVNIVHRMKAQAWVDYITFDYPALKVVRDKDQTAHTAYLNSNVDLDLQKIDGMSGVDLQYKTFENKEKLFERCRALGLTINAWTVNTEDQMNLFLDEKADFITTDEPEMLLKLIGARKK